MTEDVDLRTLIEEILRDNREMVLATAHSNAPWAATLVFGHDQDLNLYWVSDQNSRHSQELDKNPQVAAVINKPHEGEGKDKGLQIEGKAAGLEEEKIVGAAREYFAKRGTTKLPETLEDVNTLTQGRSWYVLKPDKILIIYEPLFGYGRKEYTP